MRLLLVLLSVLFFSCAAAPQLADYPRREVDRPFTLPKGVATWSTIGMYSVEKYRLSGGVEIEVDSVIGAIPLTWRQALSDRWNLIWAPIPLGAFYQIRFDEVATSGLVLGYGLGISNNGYSRVSVVTGYYHRQKLSHDFAIEFEPTLQPWFPLGEKARWDLQSSISVGPLWQAAEMFSLRAGAQAVLRRDAQTVIRGSVFDLEGLDISTQYDWRVVLPVYAGFSWSFARQWDLGSAVEYQKIGETSGYSNLQVSYELRHYW